MTWTAAMALAMSLSGEAMPPCEVIVSWDRSSRAVMLEHEMAHCWGWTHGVATFDGQFKPPAEFVELGTYPNVTLRRWATSRAKRACQQGKLACAYGGLMGVRPPAR